MLGQRYVERYAGRLPADVDVLVIPDELVEQLVGFNFHRGVLGCGQRVAGPALEEIAARPGPLTLAVCSAVHDPENVGSIIRTAAALGIDAVVLDLQSADPLSGRVLRVSMGAVFRLPVVRVDDLAEALRALGEKHAVELIATVTDADAQPLAAARRPHRAALVFGSEGHGLDRRLVELCHRRVTIAMQPGVDSLNVATAAGIFLYHFSSPGGR